MSRMRRSSSSSRRWLCRREVAAADWAWCSPRYVIPCSGNNTHGGHWRGCSTCCRCRVVARLRRHAEACLHVARRASPDGGRVSAAACCAPPGGDRAPVGRRPRRAGALDFRAEPTGRGHLRRAHEIRSATAGSGQHRLRPLRLHGHPVYPALADFSMATLRDERRLARNRRELVRPTFRNWFRARIPTFTRPSAAPRQPTGRSHDHDQRAHIGSGRRSRPRRRSSADVRYYLSQSPSAPVAISVRPRSALFDAICQLPFAAHPLETARLLPTPLPRSFRAAPLSASSNWLSSGEGW